MRAFSTRTEGESRGFKATQYLRGLQHHGASANDFAVPRGCFRDAGHDAPPRASGAADLYIPRPVRFPELAGACPVHDDEHTFATIGWYIILGMMGARAGRVAQVAMTLTGIRERLRSQPGLTWFCGMLAWCVGLVFFRVERTGSHYFLFMIWNLFLACVPLQASQLLKMRSQNAASSIE